MVYEKAYDYPQAYDPSQPWALEAADTPEPIPPSHPARVRRSRLNTTALAAATPHARQARIIEAVVELPALDQLGAIDLNNPFGVHRLTAVWLDTRPSAITTAAYYGDLADYLAWCTARNLDPLRAYRRDAEEYAATLTERYAPATVVRKLAAVSAWYGYLLTYDDVASRNPFAGLTRPTVDRDRSAAVRLSRTEAAAFLAAVHADARPLRLRTAALLGLLLTEGLRVAEVCAAEVADLGHRRGYRTLTVMRTGGKRRVRPLAPPIAAAVEDYLVDRAGRAGIARDHLAGPLFVTEPSGPHPGGKRLDRWAITKLIRRIARDARIPAADRLSPHSLRRTFATIALDAGAELRDVQDAMGHADPRTTRGYDRARHGTARHPTPRILAYLAEQA